MRQHLIDEELNAARLREVCEADLQVRDAERRPRLDLRDDLRRRAALPTDVAPAAFLNTRGYQPHASFRR
jgi:hypothetical protein